MITTISDLEFFNTSLRYMVEFDYAFVLITAIYATLPYKLQQESVLFRALTLVLLFQLWSMCFRVFFPISFYLFWIGFSPILPVSISTHVCYYSIIVGESKYPPLLLIV